MMEKPKIGIFGYGYVGKCVHNLFKDHYEVNVYDPVIPPYNMMKEAVMNSDFIFICVPTPKGKNGECDTSIVSTVLGEIDDYYFEKAVHYTNIPIICIKSTIPPTYGREYNWVFSPEYAGESTYWNSYKFHTDMKEMPYYIFGGESEATSKLVDLYIPVCGPEKEYIQTDFTTAIITKYMENTFFATKIIFCNEFKNICEEFSVDFNQVRELFVKDPRINPMHTMVTEKRGFGGKCLPKDLSAIIHATSEVGGTTPLLQIVQALNRAYELEREKE